MTTESTKELSLLCDAASVRAILDGGKTQTRRVIKPQPKQEGPFMVLRSGKVFLFRGHATSVLKTTEETDIAQALLSLSPYQPGDRLYVQEAFATYKCLDGKPPRMTGDGSAFWYRADGAVRNLEGLRSEVRGKWRLPQHMPKWAARIWLEVVGVRSERLQDISEADMFAEGISRNDEFPVDGLPCPDCGGEGLHLAFGANYGVTQVDCRRCETPQKRFLLIWDSNNAKRGFGWDANPLVWVVDFRLLEDRA